MRSAIEQTFDKTVTVMRSSIRERNLNTVPRKLGTAKCRIEHIRRILTDSRGSDDSVDQITIYMFNDFGIEHESDHVYSLILPSGKEHEVIVVDNQTLPGAGDIYSRITL